MCQLCHPGPGHHGLMKGPGLFRETSPTPQLIMTGSWCPSLTTGSHPASQHEPCAQDRAEGVTGPPVDFQGVPTLRAMLLFLRISGFEGRICKRISVG